MHGSVSQTAQWIAELGEGGGLRALDELRSSGTVSAVGMGCNLFDEKGMQCDRFCE